MIGGDPNLKSRVLVRRVRVQRSTRAFHRRRDLARRPAPCALEHHVLQQMGDPSVFGPLVRGAAPHPDPGRHTPDGVHLFGENHGPTRENGALDLAVQTLRYFFPLDSRKSRGTIRQHASCLRLPHDADRTSGRPVTVTHTLDQLPVIAARRESFRRPRSSIASSLT